MVMRHPKVALIFLVQWIIIAVLPCMGQAADDVTAVKQILLTLENGYEEKDIEKYMSVFSDEEYEYFGNMSTPDDPSDDVYITGTEAERRSALKVFKSFYIDLEMDDMEIKVDGTTAEAQGMYNIIVVKANEPGIPDIMCAGGRQVFSMRKQDNKWKINAWEHYETPAEELAAKSRRERKSKSEKELIRDLGSDDLETWATAMKALGRREKAVDSLVKALRNSDKKIGIRAANILYGTGNDDAIESLIKVLENNDADIGVRSAVATALSECAGYEVDDALRYALRAGQPELKSAALLAMAKRIGKGIDDIRVAASDGLKDEDETVRVAAAEFIATMSVSDSWAKLLRQRLRYSGESEDVRMAALESLKKIGSESALKTIEDTLKNKGESVDVRISAMRFLGQESSPQNLELLAEIAGDEAELRELRSTAITTIGKIDAPGSKKLLAGYLNSPDNRLRETAIRSLAKLKDSRYLETFMTLLKDKNESVRMRGLVGRGIIRIDQDTAFGPLVQIIKDRTDSAPARQTAASLLASLKDEKSIPLFTELLKDNSQNWQLRRISVNFLKIFIHKSESCVDALKAAAGDVDERIAEAAKAALAKSRSDILASK